MTAAIDITAEQRKTLLALLRCYIPGVAVWAYGSRVKWTARPNSDLDLVAFTTPSQRSQVTELKDALDESNLPFLVDLHVWDEVPERFHEIIRKEYVVLQETRPTENGSSAAPVGRVSPSGRNPTNDNVGLRDEAANPTYAGLGMAGEWRAATLGEFVTLQRGHDLTDAKRRPGTVPVMGAAGQNGFHDKAIAEGPGIVVGRSGASFGQVHYCETDFWPHNTGLYVTDFQGNIPRFAFYFLKALDFSRYNSGRAQPSLNRNFIYPIEVQIPPPNEQRAIAHILGTLDDKIELNRRMNETLEAMARALFKSWFVDFDPVRAKAEGRDPGLPQSLANLFPDSFENSELGKIPKGWAIGRFGDVVEQLREQENPLASPDALFHHFSIPAFDTGQSPKPEYGESIKSLKSRVPVGAVLLSKLNPEIERVWMVDVRPGERAVCSTEFLVLRALPLFTRSYVYCLARSPLFRQQIDGLVTGTSKSHQRAQVESILNLTVVVPPSPIVEAFDHCAEGLLARTHECRRESHSLAALRDTLLPKLISGELRMKHAERVLEEALS